jgi:tetratricopeptide (TPR) repeat protein
VVSRDDGSDLTLTRTEGALLRFLFSNRGRTVPQDEILAEVWGYKAGVRTRTLSTTASRLRTKIEADPANPVHLITAFGVGLRFQIDEVLPGGLRGVTETMYRLRSALTKARMVTLVGTAGVGKTSLARAWKTLSQTPSVFCDLSTAADSDAIIRQVAAALGDRLVGADQAGAVGDALAARGDLVLVLDNLEQATEPAATLVTAWLGRAPSLRLIATSRVPLGCPDEHLLRLEPLAEETATSVFLDRAGLEDANDKIRAIVRSVGCLPLAIELAASRLSLLGLDALHERSGAFKHAQLHDTVEASWELLPEEEARVLGVMGLFRGWFPVTGVETVAGCTLDVIDGLRQRSLVRVLDGRVALYEAVRVFVRARGEADAEVLDRYGEWLVANADQRVLEDLLHAAALHRGSARSVPLGLAAHHQLFHLRLLDQDAELLDHLLDARPDDALWDARSHVFRVKGQFPEAVRAARSGRALTEDAGALSRLWFAEGSAHLESGHPAEALAAFALATDDPAIEALLLTNQATAHRMLGDVKRAAAAYEQLITHAVARDSMAPEASARMHLGSLHMERGRLDLALPELQRATEIYVDLGDGRMTALSRGNLAELLRVLGELDAAQEMFDAALSEVQRSGSRTVAGIFMVQMSGLAQEQGDLNRAAVLIARARAEIADLHPRYAAYVKLQEGGVQQERGWTAAARESYTSVLETFEAEGDVRVVGTIHARLGALEASSHPDRAREHFTAARRHLAEEPLELAVVGLHEGQLGTADTTSLLARLDEPVPGTAAPSLGAWSSEARFAARLLRDRQ